MLLAYSVLLMLVSASSHAVPLLTIDVADAGVLPGERISVDVRVNDVDDLFAFNLDIGYDADALDFDGITTGGFLETGGLTTAILFGGLSPDTSLPGRVGDVSNSLLGPIAGVAGSGVLVSMDFTVLSDRPNALRFLDLNQPAGTEFIDSVGQPVSVATAPVPLPSSLSLLLPALGLVWLCSVRRRKGMSSI